MTENDVELDPKPQPTDDQIPSGGAVDTPPPPPEAETIDRPPGPPEPSRQH